MPDRNIVVIDPTHTYDLESFFLYDYVRCIQRLYIPDEKPLDYIDRVMRDILEEAALNKPSVFFVVVGDVIPLVHIVLALVRSGHGVTVIRPDGMLDKI